MVWRYARQLRRTRRLGKTGDRPGPVPDVLALVLFGRATKGRALRPGAGDCAHRVDDRGLVDLRRVEELRRSARAGHLLDGQLHDARAVVAVGERPEHRVADP